MNQILNIERNQIYNGTRCLLPYLFKEYKIVDTPIDRKGNLHAMSLIRSTSTVLVKTEHLVYPFSSFLAEFGGALGLFLGFSFLCVWDLLQMFINFLIEHKWMMV